MKLYSKAVAETDVKDAKKWLESYFKDVDDLEKYRKGLDSEKPALDDEYLDAIDKLVTAMKAIQYQRGQDSLRDLEKLIKEGH